MGRRRKLKHLDLFSGIGGFALAAQWTGRIETVAFCEIDPFCQKGLKLVLNKPDAIFFKANIVKYGLWHERLKDAAKVLGQVQSSLPLEDSIETEVTISHGDRSVTTTLEQMKQMTDRS